MSHIINTICFSLLLSLFAGGCSFVGEALPNSKDEKDEGVEARLIDISGTVNLENDSSVDQSLSGAQVTLYKIQNGIETEVATNTTDANGQFSFPGVYSTILSYGDKDYFYEVRALTETDSLSAIVVAENAINVIVDFESTVIAKSMGYVMAELPANIDALPSLDTINTFSKLLKDEIPRHRANIKSISTQIEDKNDVDIFAKTMTQTRFIEEQAAKKLFYETWWYGLSNTDASEAEWTAYMRRMVVDACGPLDSFVPLPYGIAQAVAAAAKENQQFTAAQVLDAFNAANENLTDLTIHEVLRRLTIVLDGLAEVESKKSSSYTKFSSMQQLFLYSLRKLNEVEIDQDTLLDVDQALMLFYYLESNDEEAYLCRPTMKVLAKGVDDMVGDKRLRDASVLEAQIYVIPGVADEECEDIGMVSFHGEIYVNAPGSEDTDRLHSVRVSSTDIQSLFTDNFSTATMYLPSVLDYDYYSEELNDGCVSEDKDVTYTITAKLFDLSERTLEVNTHHWAMPEFDILYGDAELSHSASNPTAVKEAQPFLSLTKPSDLLSQLSAVPTGASIQYQYSFFHEQKGKTAGQALPKCNAMTQSTLYNTSQLLIPFACDVAQCASVNDISASSVDCRVNVSAKLVDEAGRVLAVSKQQSGHYCVDSNNDGVCETL